MRAGRDPEAGGLGSQAGSGSSVIVLGGGLAGLAAATALAPRGFRVTVVESRGRLGGRAGSFHDPATGQLVDACQHVSMGCCTNLTHFFRAMGISERLKRQPCLYFMTPDRRVSKFRADPWPAPFHLARSFLSLHYLSVAEKLRIGRALARLVRERPDADPPFRDWLEQQRQSRSIVDRFWNTVLVSAVNESCDRMGLHYARKVFADGFWCHPRGFDVYVPTVPLGRLYGDELRDWLARHGVEVRLNTAARRFCFGGPEVAAVEMRDGTHERADWYLSAVPFDRLLGLLGDETVERHAVFCNLRRLETSPITSVHLWFDRPVLAWPHLVLVGCTGQWLFNRGQADRGEHYVQVVISASRQFAGMTHAAVSQLVLEELRSLLPPAREANLRRTRVITERSATFSATPGVDRLRPTQASPIPNLFLAGDWTATGWPATMESAVRSGYLAAEALLQRAGQRARILQPDLR